MKAGNQLIRFDVRVRPLRKELQHRNAVIMYGESTVEAMDGEGRYFDGCDALLMSFHDADPESDLSLQVCY